MKISDMKKRSEIIIFLALFLYMQIVVGVIPRSLVNDGLQKDTFKPEGNIDVLNQGDKFDVAGEGGNKESGELGTGKTESQEAESEKSEMSSLEKGDGKRCTCGEQNELSENDNNGIDIQTESVEVEQNEKKDNIDNASIHDINAERENELDFEIIEVGSLGDQQNTYGKNNTPTNTDAEHENRENVEYNKGEIYFTFSPLDP